MNLREALTADGRPKMLLSIMTRDINTAREIWPDATVADLGDLKLYWDPADKDEDAIAKKAFETAKKKGHAFYQLMSVGSKDGKVIHDWSEVDRKPSRVQSAPPVSGG